MKLINKLGYSQVEQVWIQIICFGNQEIRGCFQEVNKKPAQRIII